MEKNSKWTKNDGKPGENEQKNKKIEKVGLPVFFIFLNFAASNNERARPKTKISEAGIVQTQKARENSKRSKN